MKHDRLFKCRYKNQVNAHYIIGSITIGTYGKILNNTPLNVATMSTSQWYRVLLEKEVTMVEKDDHSMEYIKCRAELAAPSTDWELTWERARLKGLGSESTSFLFKLLHRILPTEERVSRILTNSSPNCKLCPTPAIGDLEHSFFNCVSTQNVGSILLCCEAL